MARRWSRSPFFRFALLLPAAAGLMIAALLVPLYTEAIHDIRGEVDAIVELEIINLEEQFHDNGLLGLTDVIQRRIASPIDPDAVYLLADSAGNRLAGNLDAWPAELPVKDDTPFRTTLPDGSALIGRVFLLFEGERLLVGRRSPLTVFRQHMIRQLIIAALGTTLLAGLMAWFFMRRMHRRLSALADGAGAVEHGALSHRLPVSAREDELDALAERFNHAFARIDQLMEASRHISSAIAHDMRRPLTRLRNQIEQARGQAQALPELSSQLDQLLGQTDQVLRTFSAILRLARIESGALESERKPVALDELVQDVAELYEPVAESEGRALRATAHAVSISGDRELLFQALSNLVENALYHGGGDIAIDVADGPADRVRVSVRDHGGGVPEDALPRLFERFYRVDTSRTDSGGSGIGLALVAAIASFHGGEARVANAHPGLVVTFDLPRQKQNGG